MLLPKSIARGGGMGICESWVSCRIPDDHIASRRHPLFMARAVLRALIEEHEQASQGARTP